MPLFVSDRRLGGEMTTAEERRFIKMLESPEVVHALSAKLLHYWGSEEMPVKYFVLPGGRTPETKSGRAVGFDLYARAVVHPDSKHKDPDNPHLRETLFNFMDYPHPDTRLGPYIDTKIQNDGKRKLGYRLEPGKSVLIGVGVVFDLPENLFQWVSPRSGLASRDRIQLGNAPGTIDPDYRGEAGVVVVNEGDSDFIIEHEMRIAQLIFQPVFLPKLVRVGDYEDLSKTARGGGGFGSTKYVDEAIMEP